MNAPLASHDFFPGELDAALEFVKRTRSELRALHRVRVWRDKLWIIDINKDSFEIRGLGFASAEVVPILRMVNAAFDAQTIHEATAVEYKEFGAGRRHPWAEDRVM